MTGAKGIVARRERILSALADTFADRILETREIAAHDTAVSLPRADVFAAISLLVEELGVTHLSMITGDHRGDHVQLLYHFWDGYGLTLETSVPLAEPHIETLTTLIPGAAFYEREVFEMLGIMFDGHPDPRPLLLPDDWSDSPPLLRVSDEEGESVS